MNADIGDRAKIADYVEALARLAAAAHHPQRAACLFGAAEAMYQASAIGPFPGHRHEHENAVAAARLAAGDEAFTSAWETGRSLLLEDAIAEALATE